MQPSRRSPSAHIWADQSYAGARGQWTADQLGIELEVTYSWWRRLKRYLPDMLDDMGFQVLPQCWEVDGIIS